MKSRCCQHLFAGVIGLMIWPIGFSFAMVGDGEIKLSRVDDGTPMPSFTLTAITGAAVNSTDLAGKVVILNFWATWCGPCKDEMPALDRLSRRFDSQGLVVLTITTDQDVPTILRFLQQLGSRLPVLLDEHRDVSLAFLVRGLPTTIFVGKRGNILARAVGPRPWDSPEAIRFIEGLLKEAR